MAIAISGGGAAQGGLGGPAGYGEVQLDRSDDGSLRLDLSAVFPEGLDYFGRRFAATEIWVNTNGTLSFGAPWPGYHATGQAAGARPELIAIFQADVDTRLRGEGVESGQVHVDIDAQSGRVSVTWDMVGAYRRDTAAPNRFQLQLYERGGGDFDIVFRYERIGWTIGTAPDDLGARVLLSSPRLAGDIGLTGDPSGAALTGLAGLAGNTGVPGLWVFALRGGGLDGAVTPRGEVRTGTPGEDTLQGGAGDDLLRGLGGNDLLAGFEGDDTLYGGDGSDTLNGGAGDDMLYGGETDADLRDVIYGGAGDDWIDGGAGNDELHGGTGRDTIFGGLGSDSLYGNQGNDQLSGGGGSDLIFGGAGDDWIDGGWGYDRLNGGAGADTFFHQGVADHGSDWIQDYRFAEGDVLAVGIAGATCDQFQVNFANTPNAGAAEVAEAFVIHRPTGRILFALVDGAGQDGIWLRLAGQDLDLLA